MMRAFFGNFGFGVWRLCVVPCCGGGLLERGWGGGGGRGGGKGVQGASRPPRPRRNVPWLKKKTAKLLDGDPIEL